MNDVGGIHFPMAKDRQGLYIKAKAGRILMGENYIDSERPACNPLSQHYGTYLTDRPKRLATIGVLANNTPAAEDPAPAGFIYCPGMLTVREGNVHHGEGEVVAVGNGRWARVDREKKKKDIILTIS